jgi:hypothetical protein
MRPSTSFSASSAIYSRGARRRRWGKCCACSSRAAVSPFSAWPPELFTGRQFELIARYLPAPPAGAPRPAWPTLWGDPGIIRERLGDKVIRLLFERDTMIVQTLSIQHARLAQEATIGPLTKIVEALRDDPQRLAELRAEYLAQLGEVFHDNALHLHFIMARADKPM